MVTSSSVEEKKVKGVVEDGGKMDRRKRVDIKWHHTLFFKSLGCWRFLRLSLTSLTGTSASSRRHISLQALGT